MYIEVIELCFIPKPHHLKMLDLIIWLFNLSQSYAMNLNNYHQSIKLTVQSVSMLNILVQHVYILLLISRIFCIHVSDLQSSADYDQCVNFVRPQYDLRGSAKALIGSKLTVMSDHTVKVVQGFRGERVPLRCQQTQRNSRFYWFITKSAPIGSRYLIKDLVPLPKSPCFQQDYHGYRSLGVDVLNVLVQQGTVGWFTCIETTDKHHFYQREAFLVLMAQPANVTLQVDLVGRSSINCEMAKGKVVDPQALFERKGVTIDYKSEKSKCLDETVAWHCITFIGDFKGYEWKDKKMKITNSGFIPTGSLGPFNRLRFEKVKIGFRLNFIRLDGSKATILGGFDMYTKDLCMEAQRVGTNFEWMILDAYLGYAELSGGYRIPIGLRNSVNDLDMIDGIQIISQNQKSIESAILQQAVYPEIVIERLISSDSKNTESMIKYQEPNPCGKPLTAANGGYLSTTYTQLCSSSTNILTAFVVDAVSKLRRDSNSLIFIHIDAVVSTGKSGESMLRVRLNGRSLTGQAKVKTVELMTITWNDNKLTFNPPAKNKNFESLQGSSGDTKEPIGGRLTMTISDEGTVVNFAFTLGSSPQSPIVKRLLLATPLDNGLEITAEVPKSRACGVCYMTVTVDRRSVTSIPLKWPTKNQSPQSVLPPINFAVAPIKKSVGNEPIFIAYRSFSLRWSESDIKDSREDLRNWFTRMQNLGAPNNVTVIFKNSWPVCPPGHHLVIPNPPFCAPCPPGTYAVTYQSVGKARYAISLNEEVWNFPSATVCIACPKGSYQLEPGKTNCTHCSQIYNRFYCREVVKKTKTSSHLKGHVSFSPSIITESKSHLRQAFAPGTFGVFFLCFCIIGLLAGVIYFFIESIGFMLIAVTKAPHSERLKAQRRANRRCKKEIDRLKKLNPTLDFENIIKEELLDAEILGLHKAYPELDWENVICDTRICWLQKCYPFIRWNRILLEELPDLIREKYPHVDWDHIIEEYKCDREIEEMKFLYPCIDWSHLLCETKINALRKNVPYLNWDGIVAEEKIRKLREAYPDINFDHIICKTICQSEINKLRTQYPQVNWEEILCEERIRWLRARHPLVNWDNIVSEARIAKLRTLYPDINWTNIIHQFICEREIEEIRGRFHCLDWESIIRGGDENAIRLTNAKAIKRLESRFPDVDWKAIIKSDISEAFMNTLRMEFPYLDWDAITSALFDLVDFKSPKVYNKFRDIVPCLESVYPYVDWSYFVEKKYASPYINWDYILREGDFNPYPAGSVLNFAAVDRLGEKYPHVNWKAFSNVRIEKMFEEHPYIQWGIILNPDDICKPKEKEDIPEQISLIEDTEHESNEATVTNEQEITDANSQTQKPLDEEEFLLKEYWMRRSLQLGDLDVRLNEANQIEGGNPRTSMLISKEINELAGNSENVKFESILDHELSSRRLGKSESSD